ncbi:hypothetical protein IQ265_20430 [Nodosilinea sp. LEGE 06152]|uniref:hypothetical protein n=1 Tax=Nodosilinea sp. LEGE 06152 TaxID=2777966 RepID=UPI001880C8EA|nr:hypothetical protein [Nodosilinea sp. LEGE 06152]MBE9159184.1 hypothetical protein [Nodosilinea sp. LEGE 06152]
MVNIVAALAHPRRQRRSTLARWMLAVVAGAAIASCRPNTSPPPAAVEPAPSAPTPTEPTPAPTATQPPDATPAAPDTTPSASAATLPDTLIHQWQPLSNVLLAFGTMTVTPNQVQWSSGQSSPYTLIGTEGGYLLRLESSPSFYDTQNQYIKLIPKADTSGAATSIEIAFYSSDTQLQSDEYIMYGSYVAE